MAKFLFQARYTSEGAKGVVKDGGTVRRGVVEKMAAEMGGKLEAFYFALGDVDAYVICDLRSARQQLPSRSTSQGAPALRRRC